MILHLKTNILKHKCSTNKNFAIFTLGYKSSLIIDISSHLFHRPKMWRQSSRTGFPINMKFTFSTCFSLVAPTITKLVQKKRFCFITALVTNLNIMQIILNKQQPTHFDSRYHLLREIFKTTASVFIFEMQLSLNASSFPGRYSVEIKSDDGYQIGLRISSFITPRIISSGSPCIN